MGKTSGIRLAACHPSVARIIMIAIFDYGAGNLQSV